MSGETVMIAAGDVGVIGAEDTEKKPALIAAAVGIAVRSQNRVLARAIEAAMAAAAAAAQAEGIADPAVIRERMLAARARVKALFAREEQPPAGPD